jgi:hypothetical protein
LITSISVLGVKGARPHSAKSVNKQNRLVKQKENCILQTKKSAVIADFFVMQGLS